MAVSTCHLLRLSRASVSQYALVLFMLLLLVSIQAEENLNTGINQKSQESSQVPTKAQSHADSYQNHDNVKPATKNQEINVPTTSRQKVTVPVPEKSNQRAAKDSSHPTTPSPQSVQSESANTQTSPEPPRDGEYVYYQTMHMPFKVPIVFLYLTTRS